ncbi:hypothetical protein MAPG_07682 [Magnaporthiopsis poae ATCC 64411]|uniref:Uncharacterized protein n=1 Tax=Magnaporthiopsis poae (strain ATCC 64411 / 73-15) TaxID=644358 RepID=A0A0C4E5B6_MAGP6|nr:hypothetical protein MAPG_07682 [Magnaporthiopsis poae ATCC 64411]
MPPHRILAPATTRRYLLVPTWVPVPLACRAQGTRHAATTASKSPATKKKTSTKSTATATTATPKKAAVPSAGPAVATVKKTGAAPVKKVTQASPSFVKVKGAAQQPKVKAADPTPFAPGSKPVSPTRPPPVKATTAPRNPTAAPEELPKPPAKVDTGSKEYKRATWSYTGAVVGVPLLLVTSYFLYDRLILGNERLDTFRLSPSPGQESVSVPGDAVKATNDTVGTHPPGSS